MARAERLTVRNVFDVVDALPAVAPDRLLRMLGYTRRSVNQAVRELAEHDLVRFGGNVRGDVYCVVVGVSRPRWKPWLPR